MVIGAIVTLIIVAIVSRIINHIHENKVDVYPGEGDVTIKFTDGAEASFNEVVNITFSDCWVHVETTSSEYIYNASFVDYALHDLYTGE